MDFKELQKKKVGELHRVLAETRDSLRDLRFKVASKQLKDVSLIQKTKKTIANILTLLNGKEAEAPKAEEKPVEVK